MSGVAVQRIQLLSRCGNVHARCPVSRSRLQPALVSLYFSRLTRPPHTITVELSISSSSLPYQRHSSSSKSPAMCLWPFADLWLEEPPPSPPPRRRRHRTHSKVYVETRRERVAQPAIQSVSWYLSSFAAARQVGLSDRVISFHFISRLPPLSHAPHGHGTFHHILCRRDPHSNSNINFFLFHLLRPSHDRPSNDQDVSCR